MDKEISANDFEPTEHLSDKHHMAIPGMTFLQMIISPLRMRLI